MTESIPGPAGLPVLGNMYDLDPANSIESLGHLADIYGTYTPLFQFQFLY
jgi:cytochrome P450/NADPH-cytochrome P450 reductase